MGIRIGIGSLKIGQGSTGVDWSSYWTQQYQNVYNAMPTKPEDADRLIQAEMMKELVDGGYYDKALILDVFATHTGGSLINWKSPGTFDPSLVNAPAFEQYKGYAGATTGTKYLRSNFIPSVDHGGVIAANNIAVIYGVATDVAENLREFGAYDGTVQLTGYSRDAGNQMAFWLNTAGTTGKANASAIGHYGASRTAAASVLYDKNTTAQSAVSNVGALCSKELHICGRNVNGTPEPCNKQVPYFFLFSGLTVDEINDVIRIMEKYLDNYSAGYISTRMATIIPTLKTKLDIVTYVEDNDEVIHPSVVNCGAAWNGYRYWMANTPYPTLLGTQTDHENPSIWASNDGINWVIPSGLTNPIYPKPFGFNSDPELFFDNNKLYCFFNSTENDGAKLISLESSNGVTWGNKTYITVPAGVAGKLLSPAIIKIGAKYYIYFIKSDGVYTLERIESSTLLGEYTNETALTVTVPNSDRPWHCDIIKIGDTYWLQVVEVDLGLMYLFYSSDGTTFTSSTPSTLFGVTAGKFDAGGIYRPSMMQVGSDYYIYYGGNVAVTQGWMTGRVKVKFD